MGGYITAEVAIQFPERVARLVLVSAAGISSAETLQKPILTLGRVATAVATNAAAQYRLAARPVTRHISLALVARYPRLKADLAYEGFFKGPAGGFDAALRASLDYDFRDRLPDVKVPTLIVWGEKDSIIPVRDADGVRASHRRQPQGRDEGHRAHPDGRAPARLQRGARGLPGRDRPAAEDKEPVDGESQAA